MLEGNIWVALAEIGYGASLQHYSELIETEVRKAFELPEGWRLDAQMPFGTVAADPRPKPTSDLDARFRILR
jgi:predicted oxidoreductase (fatty acid repression mutant protein)